MATKSREKKAWMEIKVAVDDQSTGVKFLEATLTFPFFFLKKTPHFNPIAFAGFVWFQSPSGSHCGLQSELSRPGFSSAVKRERRRAADEETERVIRGYFHVLFDYFFCFNSCTDPFCLALQLQALCLQRLAFAKQA